MFDIRVFNALATQTSIKIGQISFNVTTPPKELAVTQEELAFKRQAFQEGSVPGITWRRDGGD